MVQVPIANPDKTPVAGLIAATPGKLLVQVPPAGAQTSVPGMPKQSADGPVIGVGAAVTVTVKVA